MTRARIRRTILSLTHTIIKVARGPKQRSPITTLKYASYIAQLLLTMNIVDKR